MYISSGIKYVPFAVCCALWPSSFFADGVDDPLVTTSAAVIEARISYKYSSDWSSRFPTYSHYLQWIIALIGGDAPAFSAAFLDELNKQERPSSSLRL